MWRKATVPKADEHEPMLMSLDAATPRSAADIPDNHVIAVRGRVISTDLTRIVQNNIKTDTITLDLDGEWDDLTSIWVILGTSTPWKLQWEGQPITVPAEVGRNTGSVACSVVGYGEDGEMRLVTVASPSTFTVVESGYVEGGEPSEENLDIIAQLSATAKTANDAASSATSAASSATSAAQSANTAASSASSAASAANTAKANADTATAKANQAATLAGNAYETLQPVMSQIGVNGNVLHETIGPDTVVTADDSFPCKPVEMTVYGNTVQNLWVNPNMTVSGITVSSNDDGSVTLSGSGGRVPVSSTPSYALKPNTTYTISIDKTPDNFAYGVNQRYADGTQISFDYTRGKVATFTTSPSLDHVWLTILVEGDVSGTYRIMLNEGPTAQPWCPPGLNSVDEMSVVTAGKNLLKFEDNLRQVAEKGITFVPNEDGTVTVNGTATANDADYYVVGVSWTVHADASLPASDLVFSTNGNAKLYGYDSNGAQVIAIVLKNNQQRIAASAARACSKMIVYLSYNKGAGESNKRVYVQLELGSTATDYEPPAVTTTPIDLDGHTLNSLPDGTRDELRIDGGGNVVLEKRVAARIATEPGVVGATVDRTNYTTSNSDGNIPWDGIEDVNTGENRTHCDKFPSFCGGERRIGYYNASPISSVNLLSVFSGNAGNASKTVGDGQLPITLLYACKPQTIDLGTITPPTMAAPNVTVYADSPVPSDVECDYIQDVNIVHSRIEARIAALEESTE